ncbi:MAG: hypothetical protein ACRD0P_34735 [Stackebrandtia sp.]
MDATIALSNHSRVIAGILLLSIVTIEFGGSFVLRIVRGSVPMTPFQRTFARAGHGHAGIFVTLGLICVVLADATDLTGLGGTVARLGVPVGAILLPAGFFLSSLGRGEITKPNKLVVLIWLGAVSVAAGVLTLGIGLLLA